MGDGDSSHLYSRPGDYIVLIWGTNSTNYVAQQTETVQFDVTIRVDGLDDLLFGIFMISSIIMIAFACIISIIYVIRKRRYLAKYSGLKYGVI